MPKLIRHICTPFNTLHQRLSNAFSFNSTSSKSKPETPILPFGSHIMSTSKARSTTPTDLRDLILECSEAAARKTGARSLEGTDDEDDSSLEEEEEDNSDEIEMTKAVVLYGQAHPSKRPERLSRVYQMSPGSTDYQSISSKFLVDWVKLTTTRVRVEQIFGIDSSYFQRKRFKEYIKSIGKDLEKSSLAGEPGPSRGTCKRLYHGTRSCLANWTFEAHNKGSNKRTSKDILCYEKTCTGCSIIAYGFDPSKSGTGSIERHQADIPQRLGHGVYFSPHTSKCHYYSKIGITNVHPRTKRVYSSMILAKVATGKAYTADRTETENYTMKHWTAPPEGYHSVIAQAGSGVNYQETAVFNQEACLPSAIIVYSYTTTTEY